MTDLYCDIINGSNANPGTLASPKQTLQATLNIATRGDSIYIANTGAQILTANLSFASGYNDAGSGYISFIGWDNGGALTIQRPDEAAPRTAVGAIDGADTYSAVFPVGQVKCYNIRFQTFTDAQIAFADKTIVENCEFTDLSNSGEGGASLYNGSNFINNYVHDNDAITAVQAAYYCLFANNYFSANAASVVYGDRGALVLERDGNIAIDNIFVNNNRYTLRIRFNFATIINNTFISDGTVSQVAIVDETSFSSIYNNIFYGFQGAGATPLTTVGTIWNMFGRNGFYQCNGYTLPSFVGADLGNVGSGVDPFTNLAGYDYSLTDASGSKGAGLSNPNSSIDIGAVQSAGGSGGSSIFIINE